jgi:protein-S-isoprenylcysteine O-methyltransferase Ste14
MKLELKILPIVQVVIAAVMMYLLKRLLPELHYIFFNKELLASITLVVSAFIAVLSVYCFRKHGTTVNPKRPEETNEVINSGIYAYSRNPMYVAFVLILVSLAIYLSSFASYVMLPFFVIYITRFQIIPEERMLTKRFGLAYTSYTNKVRRWF